jgi:hypothetical protein
MRKAIVAALTLVGAATLTEAQEPTAGDLTNRLIQSRATEAVIWGMPAVNYDLMLQEFERIGGKKTRSYIGHVRSTAITRP